MGKPSWTIEQTGPAVATLRVQAKRSKDWEQWLLLTADRHFDSRKSRVDLQKKHLAQAAERGAAVLDFGDLFDAMQGRDDRRGSKAAISPELAEKDYFGALVREGVSLLEPYLPHLALFGPGNHETAVLKRNEIDLTRALVDRLSDKGSPILLGGYRGWVRLMFKSAPFCQSVNLYYHHGSGGGGPVTRGVIQTNRRAVYLPDAHLVVGGHIHESWVVEIPRARLSEHGEEKADTQVHLCLPTYKEEFIGGTGGWHHETGKPPKPLGAWWVRFYWSRRPEAAIKMEMHRAT
jgi:hypothetical protein